MARIVREEPLVERARQLRHTLVQGRDSRFYRVITFKLYDLEPAPEFHRFETNVQECEENGTFRVLVQPLLKRFYRQEHAVKFHAELLEHFDSVLNLQAGESEHAKSGESEAAH